MAAREPGTAIRKAFANAWVGNITILDGVNVPVVDEKLDEQRSEQDIYVALTTQAETPIRTKSYWAWTIRLAALLVQRTNSHVDKAVVEEVSDKMMGLVWPGKPGEGHGLTIESPFRLTYVIQDPGGTLTAKLDGGEYVIVKQLNFKVRITQQ